MSNNGAALLGGLLIGGLVVGAAMSADQAAERQHRRNMHHHHHHRQQQLLRGSTFCICGAQMMEGRIQQGVAKCNNLNCQKILTGSVCYYCPKGANIQQHRNGFFYCQQCALQVRRQGNVVKRTPNHTPNANANPYPAQQHKAKKIGGAYVVKQGYMNKKGNWFNTGYKKRYFKLWSNKKMAYLTHPTASYTKGYADFTHIKKMEKKGKHGFEVTTPERVWSFLCQSEQDRNSWFITIQSVCMGIQNKPKPAPQPQVQYVPAAQPQVKYVAAVQPQPPPQYIPAPALPNNGNVPQQQQQPQYVQQPMYRGSVIESGSKPSMQPQGITRPKSQSLQPGMVGYNVGDMYGNKIADESKTNANVGNVNNNNNNSSAVPSWEVSAPPAAFADPSAPSAPFEDDIVPSAPPEDDGGDEGAVTHN